MEHSNTPPIWHTLHRAGRATWLITQVNTSFAHYVRVVSSRKLCPRITESMTPPALSKPATCGLSWDAVNTQPEFPSRDRAHMMST